MGRVILLTLAVMSMLLCQVSHQISTSSKQ